MFTSICIVIHVWLCVHNTLSVCVTMYVLVYVFVIYCYLDCICMALCIKTSYSVSHICDVHIQLSLITVDFVCR